MLPLFCGKRKNLEDFNKIERFTKALLLVRLFYLWYNLKMCKDEIWEHPSFFRIKLFQKEGDTL